MTEWIFFNLIATREAWVKSKRGKNQVRASAQADRCPDDRSCDGVLLEPCIFSGVDRVAPFLRIL